MLHAVIKLNASVGMYHVHVCDYPYYSCLSIFWHYHPYFTLQFYSNVFFHTCYHCIFFRYYTDIFLESTSRDNYYESYIITVMN